MPETSKPDQTYRKWYRDWLAWLLIGTMVYGVFCVYEFANDVGRPFPGFFTYFDPATRSVNVDWNVPSWWWEGTDDRPAVEDLLREIDGVSFYNLTGYLDEGTIYARVQEEGRETMLAIIHRDGEDVEIILPLRIFRWTHLLDIRTSPIIIAFSLWALALILYRAAAAQQAQRIVATALLAVGITVIGSRSSLFKSDPGYLIPLLIQTTAYIFGGALFLHLAVYFPYQRSGKWWKTARKVYLTLVYLITVTAILSFTASRLIADKNGFTPLASQLDYFWIRWSSYVVTASAVVLYISSVIEQEPSQTLLNLT